MQPPAQWNPRRLFRKVLGRRNQDPEWRERLQSSIVQLERMNGATEADFLAITDKLTSTLSVARTIASGANALLASVAGEKGDNACRTLLAVLEDTREMEKHAQAAGGLGAVRESVDRIQRGLRGFERVGPSFHVIATMARIETAHLGSAGLDLGYLADEFKIAGESIRSRVADILVAAAALGKQIDSTLEDAARFDEKSLKELPALAGLAEQSLGEFRARQEKSVASATHLASQSEAIAGAIADIVASVQFHDITRQQVEHVIGSLRQLCVDPRGNKSGTPAPDTARVIALQLAQLANARAGFVSAMHQMEQRFETIGRRIRSMVEGTGALLSPDHDSRQTSFYRRMEDCFQAITAAAAGCQNLEQRTGKALADFRETLSSLTESTRDIHTVEMRLRWLAINAAINAAHIGAAGEPLQALAGEMQRLVEGCEASSGEADAALRTIARNTESSAARSVGSDTSNRGQLSDQLRTEIEELHNLNQISGTRSGELARLAETLSTDLATLRESLRAEQLFTSTVDACSAALRNIQARAHSEHRTKVSDEMLQEFDQHYTMNAEREVHQTVLSSGREPSDSTGDAPLPPPETEFGENVEMF